MPAAKPSSPNSSMRLDVALLGQELAALQAGLLRVDDDVRLAVEDLLEVLQRDVEQVADARRQRLQEPDVRDRRGQVDVAEALAAHLGLDDLDAALLAHDAAVLHALVLAAVALVVLHRPEDLGAEQAVALRLEGAVVDRLRLLHLAVRPLADLLGRRQRDADRRERQRILRLLEEVEDVFHVWPFSNRSRNLSKLSNFTRRRARSRLTAPRWQPRRPRWPSRRPRAPSAPASTPACAARSGPRSARR